MSTSAQQWAMAMMAKSYHPSPDGSWSKHSPGMEPKAGKPVEVEADLHEQIRQVCLSRGWLAFHGRMDMPTGRVLGEFDWVVLAEYPKLLLVECKSKTGKVRPEQAAVAAWAHKLGWHPTVCRSIEDFLAYCESFGPKKAETDTPINERKGVQEASGSQKV